MKWLKIKLSGKMVEYDITINIYEIAKKKKKWSQYSWKIKGGQMT